MIEFINAINSIGVPFNMIVWVVLFGCVTGVLTGIAKEIRKYGCHRQDIDFKRELVDRGLSADEVERIIGARPAALDDKPATVVHGNQFVTAKS
jgi:hypothetical protein